LMGCWWEQEEFDELFGNFVEIKGCWWVVDGNKRNLMGIFWELDENKRILMGTRGIWWEFFGNLIGNQAPTPSKNKKHPLGACWRTQLALLACFLY
jgi:hypothetical protein